MKKAILIFLAIVVLLGVIIVGSAVGTYNRFVSMDEAIKAQWSQVENQLQRRNDLIPNLVQTVKGYAAHEKEVFEHVADARAKLAGATTVQDKMNYSNELTTALSRLLVIVERYPELKANENFMRLQDELAGTENRIAVERMRYNEKVQAYDQMRRRFPAVLIATLMNFKEAPYFKAPEEAKAVPKVDFGK